MGRPLQAAVTEEGHLRGVLLDPQAEGLLSHEAKNLLEYMIGGLPCRVPT